MPGLSSWHRYSPGSGGRYGCQTTGVWTQVLVQATLVALLVSAELGAARPFTGDFGPAAADFAPAGSSLMESVMAGGGGDGGGGLDLRILCAQSRSVEMRVLCRLTQPRSSQQAGWDEESGARAKLVNKRSDGSSLSAFQHFVQELRSAADSRADALRELERLKTMGIINSNNEVVRLPDETRTRMQAIG